MSALPKPLPAAAPERRQPCGCPLRLARLSDMCIACQLEWEEWMITFAVPAVRAAFEIEAKTEEEF